MNAILKNALVVAMLTITLGVYAAKPKVIAHRGYWKCNGSAQNSISSLRNAANVGAYGSEFDVNVTSDGVAIVNHDGNIQGKVIDQTPYAEFADVKLVNGEKLPTLAEYLAEGAKFPKMKLILEIKSGSTPEKERKAVEIIMKEVEKAGVEKQTEYIAFSKNVVEALLEADPKLTVSYLNGDIAPAELKAMGCPWLDYNLNTLRSTHPEWIAEAKKNKIGINVWTVNKGDDMRYFIGQKVDYITTDEPEKLIEILAR